MTCSLLYSGSKNVLKGCPLTCLEWTTVPHPQRTWFQNSCLSDANEYTLTTHQTTTPPQSPIDVAQLLPNAPVTHAPSSQSFSMCSIFWCLMAHTEWLSAGCATEYHLCRTYWGLWGLVIVQWLHLSANLEHYSSSSRTRIVFFFGLGPTLVFPTWMQLTWPMFFRAIRDKANLSVDHFQYMKTFLVCNYSACLVRFF